MSVKMIVVDLDGTILRSDMTISSRTADMFSLCRDVGIRVVYATGRGDSAIERTQSLKFDGCIRMNGGVAYIGETLIYERLFPLEHIRNLLVSAVNRGLNVSVEVGDMNYANFDVNARWSILHHFEYVDFNTFDMDVQKAFFVLEDPSDRDFIRALLPAGLFLYFSEDNIAFISHEEAVKSCAIDALAAQWAIDKHDIVAFGDGENDVDMLKHCGTGVAMGNAVDAAKLAADCICDSIQNDGVAKWIEEHILTH